MSEAAELPGRVTRLEHDMAEVRFLATKAEKDASDCKSILMGHTGVLNAIREDQVDQGKKMAKLGVRMDKVEVRMAKLEVRMDKLEVRMDTLEDKVDTGFAEMRRGFATLAVGQARVVELLTTHIEECDCGSG